MPFLKAKNTKDKTMNKDKIYFKEALDHLERKIREDVLEFEQAKIRYETSQIQFQNDFEDRREDWNDIFAEAQDVELGEFIETVSDYYFCTRYLFETECPTKFFENCKSYKG
jgi:hypothetical protein